MNNPTEFYCKTINYNSDCYYSLAIKTGDLSFCYQVEDLNKGTNCKKKFMSSGEVSCLDLRDYYERLSCYEGLGTILDVQDYSKLCDPSQDNYPCSIAFAKFLKNESFCNNVIVVSEKYSCFTNLALYLKDVSICEKLKEIQGGEQRVGKYLYNQCISSFGTLS